ncbi:MAG TPA: sialidase family protein [Solirubrobacteraceae bacterium]|nr:sialidase family protein [Solirubrobacteraceae bacterium]
MLLIPLLLYAPPASAGPSKAQRADSRETLKRIVENVGRTTAHRYGARDDRGAPLEGLKVVQVGSQYVGAYHAPGGGRFNVHLATSRDLIRWTRRTTLDEDASQPTIAVLPNGAVLVAYEKTTVLDVLPRAPLPPALAGPSDIIDGPLNRIRVRFRYYRNVDALLDGQHSSQFTAPRSLSPTAEGTPSITRVLLRNGLISQSRIEVGLHYFADLDRNGTPDVDRLATATLTNFNTWQARPERELDADLLRLRSFHEGFSAPPRGSIGDRDQIVVNGVRLELQEAQYIPNDYSSWRLFLIDPRNRVPRPLEVATTDTSRSFGNPTATALTAPSGRPAILITMYVFAEGAAPHEAGPLVFYVER